jgi:hypothetical protein
MFEDGDYLDYGEDDFDDDDLEESYRRRYGRRSRRYPTRGRAFMGGRRRGKGTFGVGVVAIIVMGLFFAASTVTGIIAYNKWVEYKRKKTSGGGM